MATKVYSTTTPQGDHNLYLKANGKEYFLFSQNYYKTVSDFYGREVSLDRALDFSASTGKAVRKTMEKLRAYIPYIEKEYGVSVLKKTKHARRPNKTVSTRHSYDDHEVA